MVQESTMICIDNSEYMRNGDFTPTRLQCEQEAAHMVAQCKLRSNPENAVGVLSMADDVKVLSTMVSTELPSSLFYTTFEYNFYRLKKIVNSFAVFMKLVLKELSSSSLLSKLLIWL